MVRPVRRNLVRFFARAGGITKPSSRSRPRSVFTCAVRAEIQPAWIRGWSPGPAGRPTSWARGEGRSFLGLEDGFCVRAVRLVSGDVRSHLVRREEGHALAESLK
jgi:hypothetical protein